MAREVQHRRLGVLAPKAARGQSRVGPSAAEGVQIRRGVESGRLWSDVPRSAPKTERTLDVLVTNWKEATGTATPMPSAEAPRRTFSLRRAAPPSAASWHDALPLTWVAEPLS